MGLIYLYGAPASGKTTLARRLAARLGYDFVDLDEAIVHRKGRSIPEIFAADGEAGFRDIESAELAIVGTLSAKKPTVIALGGGTLLSEANRAFCEKTGTILCLEAPPAEERARRLASDGGVRPLGDRANERAAHYASFPNRLVTWFDLENSLVLVGLNIASIILSNRTERAPTLGASSLPDEPRTGRALTPGPVTALVADETVARLWLPRTGRAPTLGSFCTGRALTPGPDLIAQIPSGESNKTISTVSSLWCAFVRAGLGRRDRVVALGGGVTGDLTGFAAATFMRGMDWINIPTTLLSMTDASTGGKTGCDLAEGKNLVGAFHTPKLVVIDTAFLKTLPPEILRAGKAEMIKHALIGGRAAYPFGKEKDSIPTPAEIAANLSVKMEIVRKDPLEQTGERLKLNCGHTVAHAIETLSDYTLPHGDAVAIGCVEEARLAVKKGLADASWPNEVASVFSAEGLPTALPEGMTWAKMVPVMRGDKKRAGSVVTFALPCGWGDVRAVPIDFEKDTP